MAARPPPCCLTGARGAAIQSVLAALGLFRRMQGADNARTRGKGANWSAAGAMRDTGFSLNGLRARMNDGAASLRAKRPKLAGVIIALVAIAGLVALAFHIEDIGAFATRLSETDLRWLALTLLAQIFAFLAQAFAWGLVLRRRKSPISTAGLLTLSIGKLFADQAIPSAGVSGGAFLVHALTRRGVAAVDAFAVFVFAATASITAFLAFAAGSLAYVAAADESVEGLSLGDANLMPIAIGAAILLLVILALFLLASGRLPAHSAALRKTARAALDAIKLVGVEKGLFLQCLLLQSAARLFDGVTLWLVFYALGDSVSFFVCIIAVSLASLAATVAPTPMGLGSFEAGLTAALAAQGLGIEPAFAGGLIYRGLSLGLPLAIGFFVVQRELLKK